MSHATSPIELFGFYFKTMISLASKLLSKSIIKYDDIKSQGSDYPTGKVGRCIGSQGSISLNESKGQTNGVLSSTFIHSFVASVAANCNKIK